jgi:hypothetical protein
MNLHYMSLIYRIDASEEDGSYGRLVNDDHIAPNSKMKKLVTDNVPKLCLFALRKINTGEKITYSYGAGYYPWRQKV